MAASKTNNTPAPEKRDDSTDEPVTTTAKVEDMDTDKDMREAAGITGKLDDAAPQQRDAYEGLKAAAGKTDAPEPVHLEGPGNEIA